MGFGIEEGRYDTATLRRNRAVIGALAVASLALILVLPAFTEWPLSNALGIAAVLVVLHACLWWMFASKKAGPLETSTSWAQWRRNLNL